MRWQRVGVQWVTVAVLFAIVVAIQYYKPEWTGVEISPSAQKNEGYQAIDGDSFKSGTTEIRLYGIDAPEYRQSCADAARRQIPCGRMARDQLSKLIRSREVSCTIVDRDRYQREVAVCKNKTQEINREMVRLGWALAYRKHALNYIAAEREAKSAKRGIWGWKFERPEDYRARNRADE